MQVASFKDLESNDFLQTSLKLDQSNLGTHLLQNILNLTRCIHWKTKHQITLFAINQTPNSSSHLITLLISSCLFYLMPFRTIMSFRFCICSSRLQVGTRLPSRLVSSPTTPPDSAWFLEVEQVSSTRSSTHPWDHQFRRLASWLTAPGSTICSRSLSSHEQPCWSPRLVWTTIRLFCPEDRSFICQRDLQTYPFDYFVSTLYRFAHHLVLHFRVTSFFVSQNGTQLCIVSITFSG